MRARAVSRRREWFGDDRFWRAFKPFMFDEDKWQAAARDADPLARLLSLKPGAAVLDLCCGPGRFSLELARRGYRVTGVDRTQAYLAEARRRAREHGLAVEFVRSDMRRFARPRAYEACINMYTSIGYFKRPEDDLRVCRNVLESLKPGGTFLVQTGAKEWLAREFRPRHWRERDGTFVLEEREIAPGWTGVSNRWIVVSKGRVREFRFFLRLYSAVELSNLIKQAGFSRVSVHGDLEGAPFDNTSRWLVAVGRKS